MKQERLDKLLANLGYGSRRDVAAWIKQGLIEVAGKAVKSPSQKVVPDEVLLDGEVLDYPHGLTLIYHKPLGSVCSHKEIGRLIYEDFPERWMHRKPQISSVGRLDKETSGLLILTDDGHLNHFLTSPKHHIAKRYRVQLAQPLQGTEVALFASGTLMLEDDDKPCLPAELDWLSDSEAELTLHEGRYHQVRRMFVAAGNHVEKLTRISIGELTLASTALQPGAYQALHAEAVQRLVSG